MELFARPLLLLLLLPCAVPLAPTQPRLLSQHWFEPEIALALRSHMRNKLLQKMLQQARDKSSPAAVAAAADIAAYASKMAALQTDDSR